MSWYGCYSVRGEKYELVRTARLGSELYGQDGKKRLEERGKTEPGSVRQSNRPARTARLGSELYGQDGEKRLEEKRGKFAVHVLKCVFLSGV